MTANPSVTISAAQDRASEVEHLLDNVRAEFPELTIRVNPRPEDLLREATRRYAPEVADALEAGDVRPKPPSVCQQRCPDVPMRRGIVMRLGASARHERGKPRPSAAPAPCAGAASRGRKRVLWPRDVQASLTRSTGSAH